MHARLGVEQQGGREWTHGIGWEARDAHTLVIREIPFGTTTESVMTSIETAARKKNIQIKAMHDFTAEKVEIEIALDEEQDPEKAIKALCDDSTDVQR